MRNRRYETVFILPPDLEEGKRREILERLDDVVEKGGGIRIKREDWGVRRMAYPVNRHPKGIYYLLHYVGSAQVVAELERHMRMLEQVLRFLTVKTDDRVDLAAARKEQAEEREKEEAREAERRAAALREAAAAKEAADAHEAASSEDTFAEEAEGPGGATSETDEAEEAGEDAGGEPSEEEEEAEGEDEKRDE